MVGLISGVRKKSLAADAGIKAGEKLCSVDGVQVKDIIELSFYTSDYEVDLEIEATDGTRRQVHIEKYPDEDLGLEFDSAVFDRVATCYNNCIFCFVDQMIPGMRPGLYVRDDDYRLSFLYGNFITLTNMKDEDFERIIRTHLTPLYVSVHATDPQVRCQMMHNRFAGQLMERLQLLFDAGIQVHTQIVCCPGYNDGEELKRTLSDLETMCPQVQAVAVVPVGITRYRQNLPEMRSFTKETAGEAIDLIESFGEKCLQKYGTRVAYPGDEFYLKAERPLPPAGFYEDFSMLENGVGLLPLLMDEFYSALEEAGETGGRKREITIATGMAPREYIRGFLDDAIKKFPHISGRVAPIVNRFFGETITVSGLVTGTDLIEQLSSVDLGDELLIPACMLRREGDLFLDDVSLQDVEAALKVPVRPVPNDGYAFLDAILGSES